MKFGLLASIAASMILGPISAYSVKQFGYSSSPLITEAQRLCVFALSFGLGGFITGYLMGEALKPKKIKVIYCPGFYYLIVFAISSFVLTALVEDFSKTKEVFWVLNPALVLIVSYGSMRIGMQRNSKPNHAIKADEMTAGGSR